MKLSNISKLVSSEFSKNVGIRLLKALTIFIVGNIYLFLGVLTSALIDKYIAKQYDYEKSKWHNLLQLIYEVGTIMVTVYLIRIFIKHVIPNPLEGILGFEPKKIKELGGGLVLAFAFLMYLQDKIKSKVNVLYRVLVH
jgi:hypothetical protein